MYIASLSSSSVYGNAYLVWEDQERPILIDCGLSLRRLRRCLEALGMEPEDVAALFITHEHTDHVKAMCLKTPIAEKFGIPVYASRGFWKWYRAYYGIYIDPSLVKPVEHNQRIKIAGYSVQAFSKPHDAEEPLGFIVQGSCERAAFVMDLGHVPPGLSSLVRGVENLVFEANHDVEMEKASGRPAALIARVLGSLGHLSNTQAAVALSGLVTRDTKQVILAHLSIDCNTPELARHAVEMSLARAGLSPEVKVAPPGGLAVYGKEHLRVDI